MIAVVKADAYGHGAVPVARALVAAGCSALATWSVGEAVALRDAGIAAPLLVLAGARDAGEADEVVARELTAVLHDAEGCAALAAAARRRGGAEVSVHVEIDTGMSRMGVPLADAESFLARRRGRSRARARGRDDALRARGRARSRAHARAAARVRAT